MYLHCSFILRQTDSLSFLPIYMPCLARLHGLYSICLFLSSFLTLPSHRIFHFCFSFLHLDQLLAWPVMEIPGVDQPYLRQMQNDILDSKAVALERIRAMVVRMYGRWEDNPAPAIVLDVQPHAGDYYINQSGALTLNGDLAIGVYSTDGDAVQLEQFRAYCLLPNTETTLQIFGSNFL